MKGMSLGDITKLAKPIRNGLAAQKKKKKFSTVPKGTQEKMGPEKKTKGNGPAVRWKT